MVSLLDCSAYVFAVTVAISLLLWVVVLAWRVSFPVELDTISVNGHCHELTKGAIR